MDERRALIRVAIEDQASGATHVDPGTRDHVYTRSEVKALIAMTAARYASRPDNGMPVRIVPASDGRASDAQRLFIRSLRERA